MTLRHLVLLMSVAGIGSVGNTPAFAEMPVKPVQIPGQTDGSQSMRAAEPQPVPAAIEMPENLPANADQFGLHGKPLDGSALGNLRGSGGIAVGNQTLSAMISGNSTIGNYTAGAVNISQSALSNFNGLGNITINTGAMSQLQSAMNVTVNVTQ